MKRQLTGTLLTAVAPAAVAVPPLAIAVIGAGLLWLLFREEKPEEKQKDIATLAPKPVKTETPQPRPQPELVKAPQPKPSTPPISTPPVSAPPTPSLPPVPMGSATVKRLTFEYLAEALAYGSRPFTRKEAVSALESLGFRKTAAYKALSKDGKFSDMIAYTPDGLIQWNS
jgi:outer membrane biosynthesis protein TonB